MTAFSTADASGSFVASVILKKARNEVQIRVFPGENGQVSDDLVQRFDLDALATITSVAWFNDVVQQPKKKGKKRAAEANGSAVNTAANGPEGLLAVVLDNAEVLVLSPYSDTPVHRITELKQVFLVAGSRNSSSFWAHIPNGLIEYSISSQSISTFIKVPKTSYTCIQHLAGSKDTVAVGSLTVQFVDPAKKLFTGKIQVDGTVSAIQQAGSYLYVALEGSNTLSVYDVKSHEHIAGLECAGEISKLNKISESQVAAISATSTEIFTGTDLTTTLQGAVENFFAQKSAYVAVLYDRNQPEFEAIAELKDHMEIQTKPSKKKKTKKESTPDVALDSTKPVEIDNLPPLELYSKLSGLITAKKVLKTKVLRLCASNDDEENIKETFRLFSQSDDRELLVKHLFSIVSLKVAADPLSKSLLSIWLKWILLTHGGYILKQDLLRDNLKKLQRSFEDGMTMMSRLLALQGRLQLLKSHAEFRSQVAEAEEQQAELDSEDEYDDEDENTLADQSANVEELIVYANGENDDFDSVDNVDESFPGEEEISDDDFLSFDEEA